LQHLEQKRFAVALEEDALVATAAFDQQIDGLPRRRSAIAVPPELVLLSEPSCLIPGENRHDFEAIRRMMIEDIRPETSIEWLWVLDLVELSWEILKI
jgi:hypothetical protein